MNTRVTRLNEVQYADSEYRLQQLIAEGFVAEETEPAEEQPKKTKAKKAEAAEQPAEETEQVGE